MISGSLKIYSAPLGGLVGWKPTLRRFCIFQAGAKKDGIDCRLKKRSIFKYFRQPENLIARGLPRLLTQSRNGVSISGKTAIGYANFAATSLNAVLTPSSITG